MRGTAFAGEAVGNQDRYEGQQDDDDRDHIGNRAIARACELAKNPDRQCFLLTGREGRYDYSSNEMANASMPPANKVVDR
jgi:DNA-directed RNA polymerase beta subunit